MAYCIDIQVIHEVVEFLAVPHIEWFCQKHVPRVHFGCADDLHLVIIQGIHHGDESPGLGSVLDGHSWNVLDEERVKVRTEFEIVGGAERFCTEVFECKHGQLPSSLGHHQLPTQELKNTLT